MKLSLSDAVVLNNSLKLTPFKGAAVIDAAINLVSLSEPLKVVEEVKNQLLAKYNKGNPKFDNHSPELALFIEELEVALKREVEIADLKVIPVASVDADRLTNQDALSDLIKNKVIKI